MSRKTPVGENTEYQALGATNVPLVNTRPPAPLLLTGMALETQQANDSPTSLGRQTPFSENDQSVPSV